MDHLIVGPGFRASTPPIALASLPLPVIDLPVTDSHHLRPRGTCTYVDYPLLQHQQRSVSCIWLRASLLESPSAGSSCALSAQIEQLQSTNPTSAQSHPTQGQNIFSTSTVTSEPAPQPQNLSLATRSPTDPPSPHPAAAAPFLHWIIRLTGTTRSITKTRRRLGVPLRRLLPFSTTSQSAISLNLTPVSRSAKASPLVVPTNDRRPRLLARSYPCYQVPPHSISDLTLFSQSRSSFPGDCPPPLTLPQIIFNTLIPFSEPSSHLPASLLLARPSPIKDYKRLVVVPKCLNSTQYVRVLELWILVSLRFPSIPRRFVLSRAP